MEAKPGTRVRAKTVKEGHVVNCRDWLEFSILEVTVHGIRVRFRELDLRGGKSYNGGVPLLAIGEHPACDSLARTQAPTPTP